MTRRDIDRTDSTTTAILTYLDRGKDEAWVLSRFEEIRGDGASTKEKKAQRLAHEIFGLAPYTICAPLERLLQREDPHLLALAGGELVRQGYLEHGAHLLGRAWRQNPRDLAIAFHLSRFLHAHGMHVEAKKVYAPFKEAKPGNGQERLMLGVLAANGGEEEADFARARELLRDSIPESWPAEERTAPDKITAVEPPAVGSFDGHLSLLRAIEMHRILMEADSDQKLIEWRRLKEESANLLPDINKPGVRRRFGETKEKLAKVENDLAELGGKYKPLRQESDDCRQRLESVMALAGKYLEVKNRESPVPFPRNTLHHLFFLEGKILEGAEWSAKAGATAQTRRSLASSLYREASTYPPLEAAMTTGVETLPFIDEFRKIFFSAKKRR